jgi:ABC-type multidrug transport system ATPase subunit
MRIQVLNENQIHRIRELTEEAIEKIGFKVEDTELLKIASKAGAIVDLDNRIIKIPSDLLRELLSKVPKSYTARTIDNSEYIIGDGNQYISAIVTDPWIIDYKTKETRRPSLEDVLKNTILIQKNQQVATVGRMDFPVTEYDDATSSLRALEIHLLNHAKHYNVYTGCLRDFMQWMEIGEILVQGGDLAKSNLMTVAVAIVSPLTLQDFNCRVLLEAAARNFVIVPTICPMAGTTSPYSKDSTLLQGNIENIFLAALVQMVNPGNPFLYAFGPSVSNMRTGHDLYYTLDKVLWKIASIELGKSYSIPTAAECGGTLSHRYDMQSGAESMLFMLSAVNSGADMLAGVGSCCNANSRQKAIDRMEKVNQPKSLPEKVKFTFRSGIVSGNDVLFVEDLSMGFSDKQLFKNVDFKLNKHEKVFILGPNGCGKSTLLKLIIGELEPLSGTIEYGHNVRPGYYDQELSYLDDNSTVIEETWSGNEKLSEVQVRNTLASFLFKGEDVFKKVSYLSGGEKSRVALVKLILSEANFLILDEPTNHLDINSIEVLEKALMEFDGTILAISHDRYFINKLSTRILEIENKSVVDFTGDYRQYLDWKNKRSNKQDKTDSRKIPSDSKMEYLESKEQKARYRWLEKNLQDTELRINQIENSIDKIDIEMSRAATDHIKLAQLHEEKTKLESELEESYALWESLANEKEIWGHTST